MNRIIHRFLFPAVIGWLVLAIAGCGNTGSYLQGEPRHPIGDDWDKSVQYYKQKLEENPEDKIILMSLLKAKNKASSAHMDKGQSLLAQKMYNDAITEFQLSIAFNPSNQKALQLIEKTRQMKDSILYFQKGVDYLKSQKYGKARKSLEEALTLDPSNEEARKVLEDIRRENLPSSRGRLGIELKEPVSFKFKKTSIFNVFEVLSRLSDVNFIFDKDLADTKVTLFMTDVSFERFLEVLLKSNNLAMKLVSERTLLIYPNTQAKIKEYQDLKIRTFYLANLDAKKAVGLLTKLLSSKDIIANEKVNAVVLRGREDVLEIASRILEANDCLPSEVLLNVEILEVSRTKEKQLGLEVNPASVTFGMGKSAPEISSDSKLASYASFYALGHSTNKEFLMSLPTATLHFLKQDGDTQVLANPQLRVRNTEKAKIHVGERVPLRTNRRLDATGNITYDYQYQDVGVKVDAEPTINIHGEISLKLSLEISALGPNIGTADDPQYSIRTRTAKSVLSIRDGEPVIIGGLISDEERETIRKIPYIGEIPIFGRLFRNEGRNDISTDVIMSITPIVVRNQEIPSLEATQIWSGSEDHFSLEEPYENTLKRQTESLDEPEFRVDNLEADKSSAEIGNESSENGKSLSDQPGFRTGASGDAQPKGMETAPTIPPAVPRQETGSGLEIDGNVPPPPAEPSGTPAAPSPEVSRAENPVVSSGYEWPETVAYSIHVNSFPHQRYALERIKELTRMKYECFLVYSQVEGKGAYYRVFVGRFADYPAARQACMDYKKRKEFAGDIHAVNRDWAYRG
ncbi:MAG: tetratricopeptide repeat protein [Thermodesulfobacteriota bacterium]